MGLTSFRDERENFVALIQKPNTSHLVTRLITTQELLKTEQAHWNWNYNRATARCAQGEKPSKQVYPTKPGMGRDGTRDSRKFSQKPTLKVPKVPVANGVFTQKAHRFLLSPLLAWFRNAWNILLIPSCLHTSPDTISSQLSLWFVSLSGKSFSQSHTGWCYVIKGSDSSSPLPLITNSFLPQPTINL